MLNILIHAATSITLLVVPISVTIKDKCDFPEYTNTSECVTINVMENSITDVETKVYISDDNTINYE